VKKAIYCVRCGKREGFGKCYEHIKYENDTFYFCVDCAQIAYKIKDAVNAEKTSIADDLAHEFRALPKEPNVVLNKWFNDYLRRIDCKTDEDEK